MVKIALIAVALIALGVFIGLEMWSKHQQEVKAAQVTELMRQLIGSPKQYEQPSMPVES